MEKNGEENGIKDRDGSDERKRSCSSG